MDDLRRRFASLDAIPTPVDWAEVERESHAVGTSAVGRVGPIGRSSTPALSRGLVLAILVGLLFIALVGAALVGSGVLPRPPFAVVPPDATQRATSNPSSSAEPDPCSDKSPTELEITEFVVPDTDTGPLGRPVIAGCAAWIPSGDNFGGIHRIDLATGAISNVSPIEVVWDLDQDGESLYAIGRPANVVGDPPATLFRIDPATSEILGQLPIDLGAQTLRVVDNRAWVTGWRMGIKVYELPSGALLAEWPGEDVFAAELQFGDDAVWVRSGTDRGPVFVRIGRSTLERTEIPLPRDVTDAVVYYDVILGSTESGSIVRIDPQTGAVLSTTAIEGWVPGSLTSLVSTGWSVWAMPLRPVPVGDQLRIVSSELLRIDPASGRVIDRIAYEPTETLDLWSAAADLWVYEADNVVRRFQVPYSDNP